MTKSMEFTDLEQSISVEAGSKLSDGRPNRKGLDDDGHTYITRCPTWYRRIH